jgi:hypothetical protein
VARNAAVRRELRSELSQAIAKEAAEQAASSVWSAPEDAFQYGAASRRALFVAGEQTTSVSQQIYETVKDLQQTYRECCGARR